LMAPCFSAFLRIATADGPGWPVWIAEHY